MTVVRDSRSLLREALAAPEIDVLGAALAIAADEYPELDLAVPVRQLERLAEEVQAGLAPSASTHARLKYMAYVLGEVHGFAGNARDYADPKNSYLNEVLDRKVGIPISLSMLYQEVGRRVGLPVSGVAFPGHFLVSAREGSNQWVLDPFHRGQFLNADGLRAVLARYAPGMSFSRQLLRPALPKQFVFRMLANLKNVYLSCDDLPRALRTIELLLVVAPEHPGELRARADVLRSLGSYEAALDDLQHCLALSPDAPDATILRLTAQALVGRASWRN